MNESDKTSLNLSDISAMLMRIQLEEEWKDLQSEISVSSANNLSFLSLLAIFSIESWRDI